MKMLCTLLKQHVLFPNGQFVKLSLIEAGLYLASLYSALVFMCNQQMQFLMICDGKHLFATGSYIKLLFLFYNVQDSCKALTCSKHLRRKSAWYYYSDPFAIFLCVITYDYCFCGHKKGK